MNQIPVPAELKSSGSEVEDTCRKGARKRARGFIAGCSSLFMDAGCKKSH